MDEARVRARLSFPSSEPKGRVFGLSATAFGDPMAEPEIVLCSPVRTTIGTYGGALKYTPMSELGAAVIRETLRCAGLGAELIAEAYLPPEGGMRS
jgi:hypothetical protein